MNSKEHIVQYGLKKMKPHYDSKFVPPGSHAWTIGRHVFIRKGHRTDQNLLNHEAVHVFQYDRDGIVNFISSYIYQYVTNLIKYRSHKKAYHQIGYEKEAYAIADKS